MDTLELELESEVSSLYQQRKEIDSRMNQIKKSLPKDNRALTPEIEQQLKALRKEYDESDERYVNAHKKLRSTIVYKTMAYDPIIENENFDENFDAQFCLEYDKKRSDILAFINFRNKIVAKYQLSTNLRPIISNKEIMENTFVTDEEKAKLSEMILQNKRKRSITSSYDAMKIAAAKILDDIFKINNDFYQAVIELTREEYKKIYKSFNDNDCYAHAKEAMISAYNFVNSYEDDYHLQTKEQFKAVVLSIITDDLVHKLEHLKNTCNPKNKFLIDNISVLMKIAEVDFEEVDKNQAINFLKFKVARVLSKIAKSIAFDIRKTDEYKKNKTEINKEYAEKVKNLKTHYIREYNAFGEHLEYVLEKRIKTALVKRDRGIKLVETGRYDCTIVARNKSGNNAPVFDEMLVNGKSGIKISFLSKQQQEQRFPNFCYHSKNARMMMVNLNAPYKKDQSVKLFFPVVIENTERFGTDVKLVGYYIKKEKIGPNNSWSVGFSLQIKKSSQTNKYTYSKGKIAVCLGYQPTDTGIKILHALGDDGQEISKTLPYKFIQKSELCDKIQSFRDKYFKGISTREVFPDNSLPYAFRKYKDELDAFYARFDAPPNICAFLKKMAKQTNVPDVLKDEIKNVYRSKFQSKAYRLYDIWKENRFKDDADAFQILEKWISFDKGLYAWQRNSFIKFENYRKNLYRNIVADIRGQYEDVVVNGLDLKENQRKKSTDDENDDKVRKIQKSANLSFLENCFKEKMRSYTEKKVAIEVKCPNCGKPVKVQNDACSKCGQKVDFFDLQEKEIGKQLSAMLQ